MRQPDGTDKPQCWANHLGDELMILGVRATDANRATALPERVFAIRPGQTRKTHGIQTGAGQPPERKFHECIYQRLPFPGSRSELERALLDWAEEDAGIEAFLKIGESRGADTGPDRHFFPHLLLQVKEDFYLVETRTRQPALSRLASAVTWCEHMNALILQRCGGERWHYALIGESLLHDWRPTGAALRALLAASRVQPSASLVWT
jgi:hypothetical protein